MTPPPEAAEAERGLCVALTHNLRPRAKGLSLSIPFKHSFKLGGTSYVKNRIF